MLFNSKYTEIKISIKDETHDTVSANNINSITDIMISDQRKALSDMMNNIYIGDLYYSIKISNASNLCTRNIITMNDLKGYKCIVIAKRKEMSEEVEFMKTTLGFDGEYICTSTLTEAYLMVAANIGFLPVARKQKERVDDGYENGVSCYIHKGILERIKSYVLESTEQTEHLNPQYVKTLERAKNRRR